ncbi:hypothetical protein AALP_AAs73268U000100, partial [Arabis alpina]
MTSSSLIRPINRSVVHRICSGQVILDLSSAIKEPPVSKSTSVTTAKTISKSSITVAAFPDQFQGSCTEAPYFEIGGFQVLQSLTTFGFRGEALSSLCALGNLTVETRTKNENVATLLTFDQSGLLNAEKKTARQIGTSVTVRKLFSNLPVRSKEFKRNIRKEYGKLVSLLNAYALIAKGVRFDKAVPDGNDLGGLCEEEHGFFCAASSLRLDGPSSDDADKLAVNEVFEVAIKESEGGSLILFLKDIEKSLVGNSDVYATLKGRLENLPDNIVVMASQSQLDSRKEKSHPGGFLFTKFGGNQTALLDLAFPDNFGKLHDRSKETPKSMKQITRLFPNKVAIQLPQ